MRNSTRALRGRFDSQVPAEVDTKKDTFRITVKVEDWEKGDDLPDGATLSENGIAIWYTNDKEPYEYQQVPSLPTALNLLGAELTDDQMQFLAEALKGEKAGPAVKKLVEVFNDDLKTTAKNNAYQRKFNEKSPLTEENIGNSKATMVRNFMKLSNVSDEIAINMLKQFNAAVFGEYTVAEFRANKGKR